MCCDCLVESMLNVGWEIFLFFGIMFVWVLVFKEYVYIGLLEFFKLLVEYVKVVVLLGVGFGEYGEGYVRVVFVENKYWI